ncbi:unnamed protein product, partial [Mesorhabditis spiculigera]
MDFIELDYGEDDPVSSADDTEDDLEFDEDDLVCVDEVSGTPSPEKKVHGDEDRDPGYEARQKRIAAEILDRKKARSRRRSPAIRRRGSRPKSPPGPHRSFSRSPRRNSDQSDRGSQIRHADRKSPASKDEHPSKIRGPETRIARKRRFRDRRSENRDLRRVDRRSPPRPFLKREDVNPNLIPVKPTTRFMTNDGVRSRSRSIEKGSPSSSHRPIRRERSPLQPRTKTSPRDDHHHPSSRSTSNIGSPPTAHPPHVPANANDLDASSTSLPNRILPTDQSGDSGAALPTKRRLSKMELHQQLTTTARQALNNYWTKIPPAERCRIYHSPTPETLSPEHFRASTPLLETTVFVAAVTGTLTEKDPVTRSASSSEQDSAKDRPKSTKPRVDLSEEVALILLKNTSIVDNTEPSPATAGTDIVAVAVDGASCGRHPTFSMVSPGAERGSDKQMWRCSSASEKVKKETIENEVEEVQATTCAQTEIASSDDLGKEGQRGTEQELTTSVHRKGHVAPERPPERAEESPRKRERVPITGPALDHADGKEKPRKLCLKSGDKDRQHPHAGSSRSDVPHLTRRDRFDNRRANSPRSVRPLQGRDSSRSRGSASRSRGRGAGRGHGNDTIYRNGFHDGISITLQTNAREPMRQPPPPSRGLFLQQAVYAI